MSTGSNRQPRKQLIDERLRRSWSQQDIAERLGTTPVNVSRWERGVTFPSPYYRQKLCDLFQKSAEELGLFIEAGSTSEEIEVGGTPSETTPSLPLEEASPSEPEAVLPQRAPTSPDPAPSLPREDEVAPSVAQHRSEPEPALPLANSSKQRGSRQGPFSHSLFVRGMLLLGVVLLLAGVYFSFFYKPAPAVTSHASGIATPTLPHAWHQVLDDPLTLAHHSQDWFFDGETCFYNAQAYEELDTGLNHCNYGGSAQYPFHNLVYSLDLAIYRGDYAGLIFRLNHGNYYYFSLKIDGTYELSLHESTTGGHDILLYPDSSPIPSPFIHRGLRQWNTLTVFAEGTFQLWANGHYLATVSDRTLNVGTIAVGVSIGGENIVTNAWFRNARVWQP